MDSLNLGDELVNLKNELGVFLGPKTFFSVSIHMESLNPGDELVDSKKSSVFFRPPTGLQP